MTFFIQRWVSKGDFKFGCKTEKWNLGRRTKQYVIPTETQHRGMDKDMEKTSEH